MSATLYVPAYRESEHGAIRRPWLVPAESVEQALDQSLERVEQTDWRLVQITVRDTGAEAWPNMKGMA